MKKKQKRGKRKLIKRGKNGEPTVIDFNLSKAVIVAIVIGLIIVTITTVRIITTLIGAREESSLAESSETETNVTWVVSTSIDDEGNVVEDTDEDGNPITIPVPAGYSASKIPGETSANSGFVIYEGNIDWSTILVDEETESGETESEKTPNSASTFSYGYETEEETNSEGEEDIESEDETENDGEDGIAEEGTSETGSTEDEMVETEETDQETEEGQIEEEKTTQEDTTDEGTTAEGSEMLAQSNVEEEETSTLLDDTKDEEETIENSKTKSAIAALSTQGETEDEESGAVTLSEDDENEEETTVTEQEQNIYDLQRTTNQWVWVPVSDISRIYGVDSNGKLWGKLYTYSSSTRSALNWTESNGLISITSATGRREPDVIRNYTSYDTDSMLQSYLDGTERYELLLKELEENFHLMIKSIKEYGGFYIGRYETGGLSGTAVVQKMNTDIGSQMWYTMYEKCKELSGENDNVITSMIWGCLWDETLQWLIDSGATISGGTKLTYSLVGSNSTSWGNYSNATFSYIPSGSETPEATATKSSSTRIPTGSAEYTKVNNIYDLAGNVWDWTLEAYSTGVRVSRGGYCSYDGSAYPASYRYSGYPTNSYYYRRLQSSTFNKVRYPEILYPVRQNNKHES